MTPTMTDEKGMVPLAVMAATISMGVASHFHVAAALVVPAQPGSHRIFCCFAVAKQENEGSGGYNTEEVLDEESLTCSRYKR